MFPLVAQNPRSRSLPFAAAAGLMAVVSFLVSAGCDSDGSSNATVLSPTDFRNAAAPAEPAERREAPALAPVRSPLAGAATQQPAAPPVRTMSPESAAQGVGDIAVLVGEPEQKNDPAAKPSDETIIVDEMVGQINGKPIYANAFFQETRLAGGLRAAMFQVASVAEWREVAKKGIKDAIAGRMLDELLLSEARSLLTPEEKRGLINFLTRLKENLASANRGSTIAAEESVQTTDNTTLDAKAKNDRDKALLRMLMARYIEPRINVSWRDVQKQYERDGKKYNPPPNAYLRMIWVSKSKAANVEKVRADLAEGVPFETVASSPLNEYDPSVGGAIPPVPIETTYAETKLIGVAVANAAAQKLTPGQAAGPIEFNTVLIWVKLDKIEQKSISLEEAQIEIAAKLMAQRTQLEVQRYFTRIAEQGSRVDQNQMADRLLAVAEQRFLEDGQFPKAVQAEREKLRQRPPQRPGPARP